MADIYDDVRRDVERTLARWGEKRSESERNGTAYESRMFYDWLVGAQFVLDLLGLYDLGQAAHDARTNAEKETAE